MSKSFDRKLFSMEIIRMNGDDEKLVPLTLVERWRTIFKKSGFAVVIAVASALAAFGSLNDWVDKLYDGIRGASCDARTSTLEEFDRCISSGATEINNNIEERFFLFGAAIAQTTAVPAATKPPTSTQTARREYMKDLIIGGAFIGIFLFFAWCILAISFSKKSRVVSFALDSMKVLSGFFLGTVTGFISP